MHADDPILAIEIRKRPRQPQNPVVATRRKAEFRGGVLKQIFTRPIRRGHLRQQGGGTFGIGSDAARPNRGVAALLPVSSALNAVADLLASLERGRLGQIGGGNGGHADSNVDAIENGAGQPGEIAVAAIRSLAAGKSGLAGTAAAAWVHGRDKLYSRGIGDPVIGSGDHHLAGFQRLPQSVYDLGREFGKLIQEKHAMMRESDLARSRPGAAADQRRHAR